MENDYNKIKQTWNVVNKGNINKYIQTTPVKFPEKVIKNMRLKQNHEEVYKSVLDLFQDGKVDQSWRGLDDFSYSFRGDFDYFKNCVLQIKQLRNENKALNKEHLKTTFSFSEFNPVNLDNILHDDMLNIYQEYYRRTIENGTWILGDPQSNRYKALNEPLSRFLHYEILPLIEQITNKKLHPTYTYLSSYVKDSDLPAHLDNVYCEFTVSFLINKDVDWPIYFHKTKQVSASTFLRQAYKNPPLDECTQLDGNIGGFIMFCGIDHLHFREKYQGEFYDIILLHYTVDES